MNNKVLSAIIIAVIFIIGIGAVALKDNEKETAHDSSNSMTKHEDDKAGQTDNKPASDVQETNQVTYKDFEVAPKTIKVKKGTTVTWTNEDSAKHDVTPDTETDDFKASELFGKGETYSVTFNTVGTYNYICSPHPYMKGTVEVVE